MPAINFKKEFANDVEHGIKRQTVRKLRKDGRNPKVGDKLYLYTGLRTKSARKLKETICKNVKQITIEENYKIIVGLNELTHDQVDHFAKQDGFKDTESFFNFFKDNHGLPFYGLLFTW